MNNKNYFIKKFHLTLKSFVLKNKIIFLIITLLLITATILRITNSNFISENNSSLSNSTQNAFEDYTNRLFLNQLAGDSLSMHFYLLNPQHYGLSDAPVTLGDYSYENMLSSQQYYIDEIKTLKNFDYSKLSSSQKITYDTLLCFFTDHLDFADLCLCSEVLSPTTGLQAQLPILFAEYEFTCQEDVDNYLTLLNEISEHFSSICDFQKLKAENNTFISDFTCEGIINQCKSFINNNRFEENLLYTSFVSRIDALDFLSTTQKEQYIDKSLNIIKHSVVPAYELIIKTLSDLKNKGYCKNSNGLCFLENGKDYYEFLVKTNTGSSLSIMELKACIQQNLVSDMKTMYSILTMSPELETQFYSEDSSTAQPKDILKNLELMASADFPIPSNLSYELKYVDKSLESFLSPAFYLSAPIDAPDKNTIYINNGSTSHQDLFTTLAHEGIPGHMLQSTFFSETNPAPIRYLIGYGGYTEGWATYVEFMSYYYKYSNKQLAQALSCSASYSLALYSLCDIGINYEGWTLKDTKNFLSNYNISDDEICQNIFHAVIDEPANYLQYYVGYMELSTLREKFENKFNGKFDLKKFHKAFLSIGPTSFPIVEKWLTDEYMKIK